MATGNNKTLEGLNGKAGSYVAISDGLQTSLRSRNFKNRSNSEKQAMVRGRTRLIGAAWKNADSLTQNGWAKLAAQMVVTDKGKPRKMTPYGAFFTVQSNLLLLGANDFQMTAPASPTPVPMLPLSLTVSATNTTSFSLTLTSPVAYHAPVAVYGTKPMLADAAQVKNPYRLLTVEGFIPAATVDLTTAFTRLLGAAQVGQKVQIKFVPLTSDGFRGVEMPLIVEVTAD